MKRYFITGTDTDCGKTYVTTKLLTYFSKAQAIKPIATGCVEIDNQLVNSDAQQIKNHCDLTLDQINPWRFKLPISPHLAAKEQGICLSASSVAEYCLGSQFSSSELLFIEGAGGILVPLNEQETWLTFLTLSQIPVVLVVGMKLGCINHALLTALALKVNQIKVVGWIANCLDDEMLFLADNISTLSNKLEFPLLAIIPYMGEINDVGLALI